MPQSSELSAGTGFDFEYAVSASYLVGLLAEETAYALGERIVTRVAFQQASFGEPLDDLIVDARAPDNSISRLSLQVKRSVTISAAASNSGFREIVRDSWLTLQKSDFRRETDRYGFAAGTVAERPFRTLTTICEWARASSCTQHFTQRFETDGNAGAQAKSIKEAIETILTEECGRTVTDDEVHRFIAHFVCLKFDFLHEGATTPTQLIGQLRHILADSDQDRAASLWDALQRIAHEGAGRSAEYRQPSLLNALKGQFQFRGAQSARADLELLESLAGQWLQDVGNEIGGIKIERPSIQSELKNAIEKHRLVQVRGLPGTGKSAVMRSFIEQQLQQGPVFFLKSDRISGHSWHEFATSIGWSCPALIPGPLLI